MQTLKKINKLKIMGLIKMTDFVLQQKKESTGNMQLGGVSQALHRICNYARFLKQPLKLEMFVPCIEVQDDSVTFPKMKTIILEPLQMCCSSPDCGCMGMPINVSSQEQIDEYYIAEDKVLFKGFKLETSKFITDKISYEKVFIVFWKHRDTNTWELSKGLQTIEELILYGLQLTDTAIKLIKK